MEALSIRNLTKTYANGTEALKGINFSVQAGDFYALLGPNGAGKTTAIGIITSLVNKTGGDVEIFGHNIDKELEAAKTCIGLVPQEINMNLWEKVHNVLLNQAGYYGLGRKLALERAEKYLRELRLWDKRNDSARSLSGGMKRRLMIARALVHEPKLLILDEPTAGVDIEIRRSMWAFLREINAAGTTIILTTHYLEEAESLCRHVAIIDEGTIIEDARMSDVLRKLQREVFILNLAEPLESAPDLEGFESVLVDERELEVDRGPDVTLNDLFAQLNARGIEIVSLRNKANRLEELFMKLVESKQEEAREADVV
ncbi:MAG: ATP-binding cassette domain-containing protein [Woeseiaceae bacterium]|nr:ATP-binding cassette domain-containing protein [Woeseiaceae bacterium]NIP21532.1 ATP-binding cassette domain-containing protein [Woeseiaceae bacterium]NIS90520.1 ATP-binding cassette domain-containing protein [Woeseiaceae bacterium]